MNNIANAKKTCNCTLCKKVMFLRNNSNKIKTTTLCVLILKALKEIKPEKEFYSMRQDIYDFVGEHWNCVRSFSIFTKPNWKKMLLDTFNHCTNIETGKNFGLRASFRIKNKQEENKSENISQESAGKIIDSSDGNRNQTISSYESNVVNNVNVDLNGLMNTLNNSCCMPQSTNTLMMSNEIKMEEVEIEQIPNTPIPIIENNSPVQFEDNSNLLFDYYTQLNTLRTLLYNNVAVMKRCQGQITPNFVIPNWEVHCQSMTRNASTLTFIMNGMTTQC